MVEFKNEIKDLEEKTGFIFSDVQKEELDKIFKKVFDLAINRKDYDSVNLAIKMVEITNCKKRGIFEKSLDEVYQNFYSLM